MKLLPAAGFAVASMIAFGLAMSNGPGDLCFRSTTLNHGFVVLAAWCVPASLVALGQALRKTWGTWVMMTLAAVTAVPLVPLGLLVLMFSSFADESFALLSELPTERGLYRLYQSNCGATCSNDLVLQRDVEMFFIFKRATPVWNAERQDPAELRLTPEGNVQVVRDNWVVHTLTPEERQR